MKTKLILAIAVMTGIFVTNTSCNKHTDVKATVRCQDSLGRVMPGANVQLFAMCKDGIGGKVKADVKAEGTTDNNGEVSFIFKLPAIFDVKVTKGGLVGTAIIKVDEPGKEAEKTLIIR